MPQKPLTLTRCPNERCCPMETVLSQEPFSVIGRVNGCRHWEPRTPKPVLMSSSQLHFSVHHHLCQFHLLATSVHLQGSPQHAMLSSHSATPVHGVREKLQSPFRPLQRRNTGQLDFFKRWADLRGRLRGPHEGVLAWVTLEHP